MNRPPLFEWQAPEYHLDEKSADWYWAVGILAVAIAVASILFGNLLFAVLVIAGAVALALISSKRSKEHRFALTDEGIVIDNDLWHYDRVVSFSTIEYIDETLPPFLSVKTESLLMPHLVIPLENVNAEAVYDFLSAHLLEVKHKPTASEHLIELFHI